MAQSVAERGEPPVGLDQAPGEAVEIALAASKAGYVVGEPFELTLTVTNWGGEAVAYEWQCGSYTHH